MTTTANTKSKSRATSLALVQGLISGTQKHFPNGSFTLGNVTYTEATLVQALQELASALAAVSAAHATTKDALAALDQAELKGAPLVRAYKKFVQAAFSTSTQLLADFGMEAPKAAAPLTSEELAAKAAKMRATRTARGTTSKQQKAAIKGDVTGVTITPVTSAAAAAPAATATPASPSSPSSPSPQPATSTAPATPTAPVGTPATH